MLDGITPRGQPQIEIACDLEANSTLNVIAVNLLVKIIKLSLLMIKVDLVKMILIDLFKKPKNSMLKIIKLKKELKLKINLNNIVTKLNKVLMIQN